MKRSIVITLISFALIGCNNKDEITTVKDNYLVFKEELLKKQEYTKEEEINFDLNISIDRITEEEISYRAIIDNPKENMHNIKAMVVHDYFTDDIFPSIGIFDDTIDLIIGNEKTKGINLVGYIKTTKEIEDLNLNIKVYVEYINDSNELIKIYYNSTK